jgi:hypothetical protein
MQGETHHMRIGISFPLSGICLMPVDVDAGSQLCPQNPCSNLASIGISAAFIVDPQIAFPRSLR